MRAHGQGISYDLHLLCDRKHLFSWHEKWIKHLSALSCVCTICITDHNTSILAPLTIKDGKNDQYRNVKSVNSVFFPVAPGCRQTHGSFLSHNLLFQGLPSKMSPSNQICSLLYRLHACWLPPLEVKLASMMSLSLLKALVELKGLLRGIGFSCIPSSSAASWMVSEGLLSITE